MFRFDVPQQLKGDPMVPIAPMLDIVFIILFFFMAMSVLYQVETEIGISVPKAEQSRESDRTPGEIIINVDSKGVIVVNQRKLDQPNLEAMLKKVASLYPNQPVIIRADKKTYHESVVRVLDACAAANVWNIAFATTKD